MHAPTTRPAPSAPGRELAPGALADAHAVAAAMAAPVTGVGSITRDDRGRRNAPETADAWAESDWVPASGLRNFCQDDPILDWLDRFGRAAGFVPDTELPGYDARCDIAPFVLAKGREFERRITELLADRVAALATSSLFGSTGSAFGDSAGLGMGAGMAPVVTIGTGAEASRDLKYAIATFRAMQAGAPIIAQAILRNPQDETYGAVDLLVRSDILRALFPAELSAEEAAVGAPELDLRDARGKVAGSAPWHYRAVDIKFTTLDLRVDGSPTAEMLPEMAQTWIYNRALGRLQGYTPPAAFILGRSWRQGSGPGGEGAFERLARVEDDRVVADRGALADIVKAGLEWRRKLRHFGAFWQALPTPSVPELAPHMRNADDAPWHHAKAAIAEATGELTLLPGMNPRRRNEALAMGISRWDQEGVSGAVLGVAPRYAGQTDAVLAVNRPPAGDGASPRVSAATLAMLNGLPGALDMADLAMATMAPEAALAAVDSGVATVAPEAVYPSRISLAGWRVPAPFEAYVDFESVSNLDDDFTALPAIGGQSMIFQIGCGWLEDGSQPGTRKGDWGFRQFTVDALTVAEEGRIIDEFVAFLEAELTRRGLTWDQARLVHYSPAEVSLMDSRYHGARGRHPGATWPAELPWWDFYGRVVRAEPVAVRGAFSFGLKPLAKSMNKAGLINVEWKDGPADGLGATIGAFWADKEAKRLGIPFSQVELIRHGVSPYNEIDCFALAGMLTWCRTSR